MKIHHLRNATFIIESKENVILIDPMLSDKGKLPPFSVFKHKLRLNPTVSLPQNSQGLLDRASHCLLTHCQKGHVDHLDGRGKRFLQSTNIPVTCSIQDEHYLKRRSINIHSSLRKWETREFLGGTITAIPAQHGHGWIHYLMANGTGYLVKLPGEPSIYISSDTVLTEDVKRALLEYKPGITVVAAGYASIGVGKPILMSLDEIIEFIRLSPGKVIANHLEALNHCPMTRAELRREITSRNLLHKVIIPDDGDTVVLN